MKSRGPGSGRRLKALSEEELNERARAFLQKKLGGNSRLTGQTDPGYSRTHFPTRDCRFRSVSQSARD